LNSPSVVCANANSGILNLVGETGSILRWEVSSDNFVSDISPVVNTTNAQSYLNLASTTYYRTIVQSGVCAAAFSNAVAVTVNPASVPGTIIGAKNVCVEGNGSSLVLVGYSGTILQWELSHDNFATSAIIPNYTNTYNYNNITTSTSLRVLVQYSPCPAVYTPAFNFIINPATAGGAIDGNSVVEKNTSTGSLTLVDFTGAVIQWEYTSDTTTTWKILPVTSNVYVFTNVDTALFVRVRVQSGNCIARYSSVFPIIVGENVAKNVKIYPTISPNNDNINDEWVIDNITLCPANNVRIFNRWGDLVYEEKGYDNTSKVWRGQSNVRMTVAGHDLPEGTYFYLVDPGNGKPEFSGYVVLNR
jgi:gliding motility-associated-like protein